MLSTTLSSLWHVVSNPPVVPPNLSSVPVEQLNRLRDSLIPFRDADLSMIVWATVFVTIGVLMEVAEIQHDVREAARELKGQTKLGELRPIWKLVVALGWVLVALGLGLEWWADARINSVSTDLDTVNQALIQRAEDHATAAGASAHNAGIDAATARDSAGDAQNDAKNARQEADSLTQEITAARQQSADASSKAADAVSRLAVAEQQLAEQTQKEADAAQRELAAEVELNRLKTPRSLTETDSIVAALKPFAGTEYTLQTFSDQESFDLAREIAKALQDAGWVQKQPVEHPLGLQYFNIGEDLKSIPGCFAVGVEVHVRSAIPLATTLATPVADLPKDVQTALALRNALAPNVAPSDDRNVGSRVGIEDATDTARYKGMGDGPVIVCVGKKP